MTIFDDLAALSRRLGPLGQMSARGIELYGHGVTAGEKLVLRAVRARMDAVAPPPELSKPTDGASGATPGSVLAGLLERGLQQDAVSGAREAHLAALRQLVPDEARIIATLAEGAPAPLLDVYPRAGGDAILRNASLIGRMAAVTLPSRTASYVEHLRQLGLVEAGPEDPANKEGYELLMADKQVRAALKQGELSKLPARTVRRTLVLSAQGRSLWDACAP